MESSTPRESTGRVIAVALAFFGALAVAGHAAGVYERLGGEIIAALAIFACAFAALTVALDGNVRAWLRSALRPTRARAKSPAARRAAT